MTTSRPGLWPVHDITATNVTLPESSIYFFSGYPSGLAVPSGDHNGKLMRGGQWAQYMDLNGLRNGDWLDSTSGATAALTTTGLEYNVGDNVLTTGATPTSRAVYLIEGTRVETDEAFLNQVGGAVQGEPLVYPGATVPGRIWIYATDEGASRFESVGPAVADSPAANEMTLVGLQIDALGVITDGAVAPITKPLPTAITIPVVVPVLISHDDVTTPALSLSNTTGYALTVLAGGADITGNLIVTGGVGVTGNIGVTGDVDITGATTTTGDVTHDGLAGNALVVNIAATFNSTVTAVAPAPNNTAVTATGAGTGAGVSATGGATGNGVTGTGGATSGHGVAGTAQGASSHGAQGTGANDATSYGVNGIATNTAAYGVRGTTAAAATTSGAGVRAEALGDGVALSAVAVNGNAVRAESDTTSPSRAPVVIVPQDADASTTQVGSVAVNSSRLNKIRHHDGSNYLSVHSSPNGHVFECEMNADIPGLTGTSGEICRCTITPEVVGNVLLEASFYWDPGTNLDTIDVYIRDDTAGTNLITPTFPAKSDGSREAITVRYVYTLPSAAANREFVIVLQTSGASDVYNPVLSVRGVV